MSWYWLLPLLCFPLADVPLTRALRRGGHVAHLLLLQRELRVLQLTLRLCFVLYAAYLLIPPGVL